MQHIFLSWARPGAPALCAAVYAVVGALADDHRFLTIVFILLTSVAAGAAYRLAAHYVEPTYVLRVGLPIDTLLIAGMTIALGRPGLLAIAYFWSIALAALLLGPRETLGNTLFAMVCAGAVPYLFGKHGIDFAVVVTDVLVIGLIGGLLALLPISVRRAEEVLARERHVDSAALAVAERIRSTLELPEMIEGTLEELLRATGAVRAVLRLATADPVIHQRTRPGVEPVPTDYPSPTLAHVIDSGRPIFVASRREGGEAFAVYMQSFGIESLVGYPLLQGGIVIGAIGLHDDRPRRWRTAAPLLARIAPQVAAAITQAQVFEQQRETLARLEELARLREQLVASVSHELRTPLTATIGFLQTLSRADASSFTDEQRDEFLRLALTEAERLARLVDDLLELTRLQHGTLPLEPERVDLGAVVRDVVATLPDAQRTPPVLELEEELAARVDANRMRQVLGNLVTNAFRHGEGAVAVRAGRANARVFVEIADEGPDIEPDVVPHLFVPFARWSTRSDGSGLGLAIARTLVEAHGGTLAYRPSGNGRPHAFVVELPAI